MTPVIMLAKYEGTCLYCGREIRLREKIAWEKDVGIAHALHFSEAELKRKDLLKTIRERGI